MIPAITQPITPPIPLPMKFSDRKSWEPNLLSSLDYWTIIASETTIIKATDKLVTMSKNVSTIASSGSMKNMIMRDVNCMNENNQI